jgi:hypothetical protein
MAGACRGSMGGTRHRGQVGFADRNILSEFPNCDVIRNMPNNYKILRQVWSSYFYMKIRSQIL